jgi:hypothetical protein
MGLSGFCKDRVILLLIIFHLGKQSPSLPIQFARYFL